MWEAWVWSLGWEDPLEKEMASHSSILAWRIPWTEEPGGLQSTGLQRVRHDWATSLQVCHGFPYKEQASNLTTAVTIHSYFGAQENKIYRWFHFFPFSSVQLLSRVRLFATSCITARQASLSITNSWSSPKLMCIESVMPSSHLILCCPLLLLPPIPPSIRVFSNESTRCMRWPKYWSFSLSISPSNEHPGLVSFRMDWLDPLCKYK